MSRNKWVVWLSVFLSLALLVLSSGTSGGENETPAAAEEATTTTTRRTGPDLSSTIEAELAKTFAYLEAVHRQQQIERWAAAVAANEAAEAARRAEEARRQATVRAASSGPSEVNTAPTGRCGGDLPPCWVMERESGGDPNAYNPTACSGGPCYGKWQCDPGTCDGTGTEEEQDAEARRVWDGGRGCAHWDAC